MVARIYSIHNIEYVTYRRWRETREGGGEWRGEKRSINTGSSDSHVIVCSGEVGSWAERSTRKIHYYTDTGILRKHTHDQKALMTKLVHNRL